MLTGFKGNGGMKQHREFPLRNGRSEMLGAQLVEGRAADEPLLPTKGGRHFGENHLGRRHREVANSLGMPSHFDCYSWRHCWHLEMLDAGIRIDRIAKLAGNSPQYILKNYSAGDDRVADDLPEAV